MTSNDDRLERELSSLKHTVNLSSPIFQGHVNDWKSHSVTINEHQNREDHHRKNLSSRGGISTPITKDADVSELLREENQVGSQRSMDESLFANTEEELCGDVLKSTAAVPVKKKLPRAKQMHMDGILHGLPGMKTPAISATREAHEYCGEMQAMNRDKDMTHFRTRDQYSDYVEARARFSKMHSVN